MDLFITDRHDTADGQLTNTDMQKGLLSDKQPSEEKHNRQQKVNPTPLERPCLHSLQGPKTAKILFPLSDGLECRHFQLVRHQAGPEKWNNFNGDRHTGITH